jgi:hypothetical protein
MLPTMRISFPAQPRTNIEPQGGRVKTGPNRHPMGFRVTARHNPRAGSAGFIDGCAEAKTQGLMTLNDVALRSSMSTRFIRKHLREIPHYRASARGKIWIDWSDFQSWISSMRVEIRQDDPVVEILRDLALKRGGAA